ncbi:hypothetical protein ACN2AU_04745 [Aerococcus viridans]
MNNTIWVSIIGLITTIVSGLISSYFTSKAKDKEILANKEKYQAEKEALIEKHKHALEIEEARHQHEIEIKNQEIDNQVRMNNQFNIDNMVAEYFQEEMKDPNSLVSHELQKALIESIKGEL